MNSAWPLDSWEVFGNSRWFSMVHYPGICLFLFVFWNVLFARRKGVAFISELRFAYLELVCWLSFSLFLLYSGHLSSFSWGVYNVHRRAGMLISCWDYSLYPRSPAYQLQSGAASILVKELGASLPLQCALVLCLKAREGNWSVPVRQLAKFCWVWKGVSSRGLPNPLCWLESPLWEGKGPGGGGSPQHTASGCQDGGGLWREASTHPQTNVSAAEVDGSMGAKSALLYLEFLWL